MTRRKFVFLPVFILLAVLGGWLGGATVVWADHNDNEFGIGPICYSCHVLNALLADPDPNTSFITKHTRTYDTMLSLNNGSTPDRFGCTFCHYNTGNVARMKDVLEQFNGKQSQHPVDRSYALDNATTTRNVSLSPNTNTTRWMSNWDNSWAEPANQIGCTDCHDVTNSTANAGTGPGGYPEHPDPAVRSANPVMLRGGASSWGRSPRASGWPPTTSTSVAASTDASARPGSRRSSGRSGRT